MPSASSIARRTDVAAAPMLAISPLRRPLDSAAPMATNLAPVSFNSLMIAHVFVLPTSSATRYFSFFVNPPLLLHFYVPGQRARLGKSFSNSPSAAFERLQRVGAVSAAHAGVRPAARFVSNWPRWSSILDSPPPAARTANPPNRRSRRWPATDRYFPRASDTGCQNRNRRSAQGSAKRCRTPLRL